MFKVILKKDDTRNEKHALSITSNGWQWMTFSDMSLEQVLKVEKACHAYLKKINYTVHKTDCAINVGMLGECDCGAE